MRRSRTERAGQLQRKQRSIWFVKDDDPLTADYLRRRQQHYLWMFIEDLSMRVVPSSINRDQYEARLIFDPPCEPTEQMVARGFSVSGDRGYHRGMGYPFSEFVRLLVSELCSYDQVTYEIVYLYEADNEAPVGFELMHLNPGQLRRKWGRVSQVIPPDVARERGVSTEIELPVDDLVSFRLPRDLRHTLVRTLEALDVLSDRQWAALGIAAMDGKVSYDFSAHNRSTMLALAEATRVTGWNVRGTLHSHTLSTFWLRREVAFHRFVGQVRREVLEEVNTLLLRLGAKLNFSAQLRLEGFPTDAALDDILAAIDAGSQPLAEIVNRLSNARRQGKTESPGPPST